MAHELLGLWPNGMSEHCFSKGSNQSFAVEPELKRFAFVAPVHGYTYVNGFKLTVAHGLASCPAVDRELTTPWPWIHG